ncbi:MAG: glycosyltransferase family 4 protein [Symbiobacteriia bacterium]
MKVLLATYWRLPHVGGINSYVTVLRAGLESLGHQVDVLAHGPERQYFYLTDGSRKVGKAAIKGPVSRRVEALYRQRLPGATPTVRQSEAERYTFELAASSFNLRRYGVIHAQDVIAARALSRVRPHGVPLVATIHSPLVREHLLGGPEARINREYMAAGERLGLLSADRVLVPSLWLKKVLEHDYALPVGTVTTVYCGLDIGAFLKQAAESPRSLPDRRNRKVILCPARQTLAKGQGYLLSALGLLARRRKDFVCWLAGDGPTRRSLERQARELGLGDRLVFLGARGDVPALLTVSDIVVLPSLIEGGAPYAVQEAQTAGKPVVASCVGGLPEVIQDGVTGLLVQPRDPRMLAQALERLLTDQSLRHALGSQAQMRARINWDSRRMTAETVAHYRELLR